MASVMLLEGTTIKNYGLKVKTQKRAFCTFLTRSAILNFTVRFFSKVDTAAILVCYTSILSFMAIRQTVFRVSS